MALVELTHILPLSPVGSPSTKPSPYLRPYPTSVACAERAIPTASRTATEAMNKVLFMAAHIKHERLGSSENVGYWRVRARARRNRPCPASALLLRHCSRSPCLRFPDVAPP